MLSIGAVEPLKEHCREARAGRTVEALFQTSATASGCCVKNPGSRLAAVITLALGIGANAAIFSVVYGVLLAPAALPRRRPIGRAAPAASRCAVPDMPFSVKEMQDYCDANHTLSGIVEHHTMGFLLIGTHTAERVETAVVSGEFLRCTGRDAALGRTFVDADDRNGVPAPCDRAEL